MKRALALVGAVLLVAVAVVVRGALDDDSSDDGVPDDDADLVVACVPELRAACEALEGDVRIEDPAETIAHADDIDAWVTFDPWPEMAGFELDPNPLADGLGVASSPLKLLVRTTSIPDGCDPLAWTCLVDDLDDGVVIPPSSTALGRLVLGAAAQDFFPGVSRAELFDDAELNRRLEALGSAPDPIDDIFAFAPAGPQATATTGADLNDRFDGRREDGNFTRANGPDPVSIAVVVAGPAADRVAGSNDLLDGLASIGWALTPDVRSSGLPPAGVLFALQEVSS